MRLLIAAIGKARDDAHAQVYDLYANRIRWPLSLREVEIKDRLPADRLKAAEGERLLSRAVGCQGRRSGRAGADNGYAELQQEARAMA